MGVRIVRARRVYLAALVGILAGAAAARVRPGEPLSSRDTCRPDTCRAPERRLDEASSHPARSEHHPCDWVETCQVPCAREGAACCHAEWNCPPDLTLPRC